MKQYNSWQSYKRLLRFVLPYKKRLVVAVICMAFSGLSNVVVPWLIKDVIDKVLANKDVFTSSSSASWPCFLPEDFSILVSATS